MYNADFNAAVYEEIMSEAGLNRFIMSVKQWVSPQFKLYLIKEFERLKKEEQAHAESVLTVAATQNDGEKQNERTGIENL